uniref:Uncharacterized protein n=1 Tax=Lygus hesperus TaxID=30085 RepID=A0A0K8SF40_LYGHE
MRGSSDGEAALVADIKVNGVGESGRPAFLDNRIVNADATSYLSQTWSQIAKTAAHEKHSKYDRAAEDLRGSFTPLVCSCDGALGQEFHSFLKRAAHTLADKWNKSYSQVMGWVRVKVQFAVIRAVSLRLRGARRKIWSIGLEDGAGLPQIPEN